MKKLKKLYATLTMIFPFALILGIMLFTVL